MSILKRVRDELSFDLSSAMHVLWRDRGYTATAVVTLALAIGLNVTVYVATSAVLLRGFPLVDGNDKLLYMQESLPAGQCCIRYADFEEWRTEASSFESLAFVLGQSITFAESPGARSTDMRARVITADTFDVLRVQPLLGRNFVATDESPGAAPVVILDYDFWQARFGGQSDIVGRDVVIDGMTTMVIGIMPAEFDFPERDDLWMPLVRTPELLSDRTLTGYLAVGRLAAGATQASARAELETINRRLEETSPATNRDVKLRVGTFAEFFIGPGSAAIYWSVWAAGCFVLLIACANLANLALARSLSRSHELSTRIALGSGSRRLVQQTLCEWLLIAIAGGAIAWFIVKSSVGFWAAATDSRFRVLDYSLNGGTLTYLIVATLCAVILISLAPIGRVVHLDVRSAFRGSARGASHGRSIRKAASLLVGCQMMLAIILLCGAGVLVRSFWNVVSADVGVAAPQDVLIGLVTPPRDEYGTANARRNFYDALVAGVSALPGIESAALSNSRPVNVMREVPFEIETRSGGTIASESISVLSAGPNYFHTLGATVLTGRAFNEQDDDNAPPVAVVNQSFVTRYFNGEDPTGQRLRTYEGTEPGEWRTIVGVVSNIMQSDPIRQRFVPLIYTALRESPSNNVWLFARAVAPTAQIAATIRAEVLSLDPYVTLEEFSTLEDSLRFIESRMDLEHVNMGRLAAVAPIFAAVAILLAAMGLYAVLARMVAARTREIGIRMAIGATRRNIRGFVMRHEMSPVLLGVVLGLVASLGVNRVFESQLVGVSSFDPITFAATPIALTAIALIACLLPARRAMQVDPAVSLRDE